MAVEYINYYDILGVADTEMAEQLCLAGSFRTLGDSGLFHD
jgi:hypothetical protein